jgi:ABC-type amino acid transport system permease subunit
MGDGRAIRREYYAGGLLILIGLIAGYVATTYELGTLADLGPGFFPLMLSVLLVVLGLATVATAKRAAAMPEGPAPMGHGDRTGPEWRGWSAIILAVIAFIVLANYAGAALATFACVFIAALGDRRNTVRTAALLAAGLAIFATVVLVWGLRVQMPIFGKL